MSTSPARRSPRQSGAMSANVRARYDEGAKALVIQDRIYSRVTRIFGLVASDVRFETTTDFGNRGAFLKTM
ncbi:MAG: hypothetical protein ACXVAF_16040 [Vulcanimicrobiaceae bacterium]